MKHLLLCCSIILSASASTQTGAGLGGSLLYDFKSRTWLPVASAKVLTLDFKGLHGVNAELRFLGGVEEARGLFATAIVFSYPVAKQLSFEVGGAVRFTATREPAFGALIGASVKF